LSVAEIHIDFETRSAADLRKTGLYVYAEDPTTDVWCACWCVGDGPIHTWVPGEPFPHVLRDYIDAGALIYAHNAGFEHALWTHVLTPRYGWPVVGFEQFRCTAAMAAAMALPRDLAGAAVAMGSPEQKDMTGKRLMMQLARPRRVENGTILWWDVPEKIARLIEYCEQDVEVERALTKVLRPLSDAEHAVWQMDHVINTRGVRVDLASVRKADRIVKLSLEKLDQEISRLTGGRVDKASQAARLTEWLREQGVDIDSVDKATVKDALKGDVSPRIRRVLEIRQEAAKSSTAKLEAMKLRTSADGRSRETVMYHGASTGRWCLAEGSKVLTKDPDGTIAETPIQFVTTAQDVWDGTEWVTHEGVVFSGVKKVIYHDGVLATPQHKVFISDTEYATMACVKEKALSIFRGNNDPYNI